MFNFTVDTAIDTSAVSSMIRISFPMGYEIETDQGQAGIYNKY